MCGIAGCLVIGRDVDVHERAQQAEALIAHRGPDGSGSWCSLDHSSIGSWEATTSVLLLHRRLSIIDLSEAASQPMCSPDGRHVIVFNGEIYNYLELRRHLERHGEQFRTGSDTEVLLRLIARRGPDSIGELRGMFAFAVLDRSEGTMLLARDRYGIKPLYIAVSPRMLGFASEPAAALEIAGVRPQLRLESVWHYLRHGRTDEGTGTLFSGLERLEGGQWKLFDVRSLSCVRQGSIGGPCTPSPPPASLREAVELLKDALRESVRLHLRSDVPVGAALSGGLDSSLLLAVMREVAGRDQEIRCFSYSAGPGAVDEYPYAEIVAEQQRARLTRVAVAAKDFPDVLSRLVRSQGEPFTSTSMLAQQHVYSAAREHGITVMLNGQGADELFGGYRYFLGTRIVEGIRAGRIVETARLVGAVSQLPDSGLRQAAGHALRGVLPAGVVGALEKMAGLNLVATWIRKDFQELVLPGGFDQCETRGASLQSALDWATHRGVLPHLLRYDDRNSMSNGVESRVPFLIQEVEVIARGLPSEYLIGPDALGKRVLREVARDYLPLGLMLRRDKVGFETPQANWLRENWKWVHDTLCDSATRLPFLDVPMVLKEAIRGDSGRTRQSAVFRVLCLVVWANEFGLRP